MKPYQRQFIEFALSKQVLKFGEFTLKSGRKSPYFFNAGLFNTGRDLALLGRFYAEALVDSGIEFDLLFGPAYKGIPIATTTAVALAEHHDRDLPYCFNRKEAKTHGEGGNLVGSPLQGRVMLVDDVITAGTAIRESMEIIQANGAQLAGVLISLDRQERGRGENLRHSGSGAGLRLPGYLDRHPERADRLPGRETGDGGTPGGSSRLSRSLRRVTKKPGKQSATGQCKKTTAAVRRPAASGRRNHRRTVFELAAHKARQHALAEGQQLAGQQRFVETIAFAFAHFFLAHHLTQLHFDAFKKLVDTALQPILFEHQRVSGEDARQPRITLAKPKNQQNNQAQARGCVLLIFQNQIDARNQTVFNELDQAVKHAGFAGKMAIQRGFRNADGSRQFRGGNTLATIAGFQH